MAAMLSACGFNADYLDPYKKPYAWHPTDAAMANIAAQVVDPHDLVVGRSANEGDAKEAMQSIDRIWQDKPKHLPSPGDGAGGSSGGGGSGGGSGGSSGSTN